MLSATSRKSQIIGTQEKAVLSFKNDKNYFPRNAKKPPIRKHKLLQNSVPRGVACSSTNSY